MEASWRFLKRGDVHVLIAAAIVLGLSIWAFFALPQDQRDFEHTGRIIELGVLGLGLSSLLLLFQQNQQVKNWNKLLSYHQFFGNFVTSELSDRVQKTTVACGYRDRVQACEPITADQVRQIRDDDTHRLTISEYLDEFEEFCGAVNAGVVFEDYAYTLEATRVMRAWKVYAPYVRDRRATVANSRFYLELEVLATRWEERRAKEVKRKNAADGVRPHL